MSLLKEYYFDIINNQVLAVTLSCLTIILIVLLLSFIVNRLASKYIVLIAKKFFDKSNSILGKYLLEYKFFVKLSHIIPGIFAYVIIGFAADNDYLWTQYLVTGLQLLLQIYITITIILFLVCFVDALFDYLENLAYFKNHSLRSYAQVIKIILYIIGFILVISSLLNKSPIAFLTGLGALSAVLMLVFKDTILGFVTNVQVAALDLVRVGDWITIPSANVDGTVMDVSINTVKIRNFDKTISMIPTYTLTTHSVQNWRGMVETGGRRIKRSINIDIDTIKFCDQELLEKLSKETLLADFIKAKDNEKLTNISLFRAYIENYLRNHPKIHLGLTFLIRELQPTQFGLPVELYIFTNDTNWVNYEKIQADIFDYVFASLHMFDLKAFQAITGRINNKF
ncbi:mechanosensitive ion channel family protein [Francisella hispaniensis]|uniref:mechanosensitive ion channel family protein n=1 Tax=Francisella hispaniensis TaxID=622488 RepID=UPI001903CC8E|nr:mechanosensitive ion channel domain-containing protein [Francisella hispaniensis]MBK2356689.1 mechanosensitive ion channel [Francisella hispaniensis]